LDFAGHKQDHSDHPKIDALNIPELDQCVHCGLCLNQCPTYRALHLEPESPRGRIHLVRAAADGRIELNNRFADHLYLCLMCRACETACPSGVHYGRIAEAARAVLGPPGSALGRAALKIAFTRLLPYPRRIRAATRLLRIYQRMGLQRLVRPLLPLRLQEMESMLPPMPERFFNAKKGNFPASGERRARVAMLSGCVMSTLFSEINEATVRVLRRNGCEIVIPQGQNCCAALNIHNGETRMAKEMARRNIDAFLDTGADAIVVNAAGCGAAMKEYHHLLRDDSDYAAKADRFSGLVKDVAEFLADLGPAPPARPVEMTVAYQDPCHLAHGQRVRTQPRRLLASISGLKIVDLEGSERCCGSAGIYNLTHPEMSQELLKEKMKFIALSRAEAVVAPNPGCMLQLRYGSRRYGPPVKVYHLMDLLDHAYAEDKGSPL
jgi:glycolate oxidase iron-sulfur subunit